MTLGFAASIVIGVALLAAGGAKVAAGPSWPMQARALGAPEFAIAFVPWIEIVIGALLCAGLGHPYPAIVALSMLVAFSVLLITRLIKGQHPPCACFGSWSARPLGWRHLIRNVALIAIAMVAVFA